MPQRLRDIRPGDNALGEGVSLVFRGANRRRFGIAKAEDSLDPDIAAILEQPAAGEGALLDLVRKVDGDESVEKAVAALQRTKAAIYEAFGDKGVPEDLAKAMQKPYNDDGDDDAPDDDGEMGPADDDVEKAAAREVEVYKRDFSAQQRRDLAAKGHALPDGSYPIESKADIGPALTLARSGHGDSAAAMRLIKRRAKELGAEDQLPDDDNVTKEDDRMSETAQAVPVLKEDGSWDLSGVPEEQRPAVEAVIKAQEDKVAELEKAAEAERTKADEALEIAKSLRDGNELRAAVAKSESLQNLAKDDDEFGAVLRDLQKAETDGHLPEGTVEKLETVLKAADEAVAKGGLFDELGRAGSYGKGDAESRIDAAAAELRKADPDLTKEQAVAKALDADPDLYRDYSKEVA